MARKGQKYQKYSPEKRAEIVNKLNAGYSSGGLEREYGISNNTIRMWAYQIRKGNTLNNKKGRPKGNEEIDYKERYEILKNFQAFLKESRQGKR
jgi:transposase-like protein